MPINTAAILAEIDSVLAKYEEVEKQYRKEFHEFGRTQSYLDPPSWVEAEVISLLHEAIIRLAPVKNYGGKALEGLHWVGSFGSTRGCLSSFRASSFLRPDAMVGTLTASNCDNVNPEQQKLRHF